MRTTIKMPKVGETAEVVVVLRVPIEIGDQLRVGDVLVDVETDKVDTEIPSPIAGRVIEILVTQDQEVEVGHPICVVEA